MAEIALREIDPLAQAVLGNTVLHEDQPLGKKAPRPVPLLPDFSCVGNNLVEAFGLHFLREGDVGVKGERLGEFELSGVQSMVQAFDGVGAPGERQIDCLRNGKDFYVSEFDLERRRVPKNFGSFAPTLVRRFLEDPRRKNRDVGLGGASWNEFAAEAVQKAAERAGNIRD